MTCVYCRGTSVPPYNLCEDCLRRMAEAVSHKRTQIANEAMRKISEEADEVYRQDPTKGRGRGPKWMNE